MSPGESEEAAAVINKIDDIVDAGLQILSLKKKL